MARRLFIMEDVADFAPGAFENTAVEDGCIQLGRSGGIYLHSGCYTSPVFRADAFLRLRPSWNAATPKGTAVEAQVRIAAGGVWSRWFSFGKWSPFIERSSPVVVDEEWGTAEAGLLALAQGHTAADAAQIRIYLYSDDQQETPKVYLLGMAVEAIRRNREESVVTERVLRLPAYACLRRDPAIAPHIATPTAICMLLNRWGEDALPEEVSRASYDVGVGSFGNLSFATAIAGAYGHRCYLQYGGLDLLRQQVRRGNAVGACVRYSVPSLEEECVTADNTDALPVLVGAEADSFGHLVVVRGFMRRDGEEWVVLNDPLHKNDNEVMQELMVEQFNEIYTGVCLVLQSGAGRAGEAAPQRRVAELHIDEAGCIKLISHGTMVYPGDDMATVSTTCYTLPEPMAYASAAQKVFYYLQPEKDGKIFIDKEALSKQKVAVYHVGSLGEAWVAEKIFN